MVADILVAGGAGKRDQFDIGLRPTGIEQDAMQVDPMNYNVRLFEARRERGASRDARDNASIDQIEHQERTGNNRLLQHLPADA